MTTTRSKHIVFLLGMIAAAYLPARADIIIATGVNNQGTDNVLFNDPALLHSGLLVQGNFAGSGAGYLVHYTSISGNNLLMGSGGQATVEGLAGNDPLLNLRFALSGVDHTFTRAVFNIDAAAGGTVVLTVTEDNGQQTVGNFALAAGGQNFFTIDAINNQKISSIAMFAANGINDLNQTRIGGFAGGQTRVPDGGSTLGLLGGALALLALARRKN